MNGRVDHDFLVSQIANAIGEPARTRMLYSLLDGHARTSTELAVVAEVSPSTASVHLNHLRTAGLVNVVSQGKHRYYSLAGENVARALERLSVLAGVPQQKFVPSTPVRLRIARTCYDHIAGRLGVLLHNHFRSSGWIAPVSGDPYGGYEVTASGERPIQALGISLSETLSLRRRFAYACLDWSERQPHIGGGFGAALLSASLKLGWIVQDLDSRCLHVTARGRREMITRFGINIEENGDGAVK